MALEHDIPRPRPQEDTADRGFEEGRKPKARARPVAREGERCHSYRRERAESRK